MVVLESNYSLIEQMNDVWERKSIYHLSEGAGIKDNGESGCMHTGGVGFDCSCNAVL